MPEGLLYIVSIFLGGGGAWIIQRFAHRHRMIDSPTERSSHAEGIPRGGGVGILAALTVSALFLGVSWNIWVPAVLVSVVSLCDDRSGLSPRVRLLIHFAAAAFFLGIPVWGVIPVGVWFFFLLFIVGTANFYNFMDGIDGIAGITGAIGFGFVALYAFRMEENILTVFSLCVALSCVGFLPFNLPKARVFMGDVGSVLLGFVFAQIVILLSKTPLDFVCLISFLFPFYADEITTMAVRLKGGENLAQPHRRHVYQLLANERGIAHWKISTGYGFLQVILCSGVLLLRPFGVMTVLALPVVYLCGFVLAGQILRKRS